MKAKGKSEFRENNQGFGGFVERIKNNKIKVPCTIPGTYRCLTLATVVFNFSAKYRPLIPSPSSPATETVED